MDTTFQYKKTSTTPTFCKRNFSRMHDIGDMNFFSFLTFIGNHRFGSKGSLTKIFFKIKFVLVTKMIPHCKSSSRNLSGFYLCPCAICTSVVPITSDDCIQNSYKTLMSDIRIQQSYQTFSCRHLFVDLTTGVQMAQGHE